MIFSWSAARRPEGIRVYLTGEVDISVSDHLYEVLGDVSEWTFGMIEVDLRRVQFLDCTGISALVRARTNAHQSGRVMFISHPQGIVRRVLHLTGMLRVLTADVPMEFPHSSDAVS